MSQQQLQQAFVAHGDDEVGGLAQRLGGEHVADQRVEHAVTAVVNHGAVDRERRLDIAREARAVACAHSHSKMQAAQRAQYFM